MVKVFTIAIFLTVTYEGVSFSGFYIIAILKINLCVTC
jgi:hypothetical protein